MKKDAKTRQRVFTVLFMLIVTLVFISVTTVLYTLSKDTIKLNELLRIRKAVLYSGGVLLPDNPKQIESIYKKRVREVKDSRGLVLYYEVYKSGSSEVQSYVLISDGPGLWGTITAAVGYDSTLQRLTGFEVIDQNETPGLGGRITEAWFMHQFRGKKPPLSIVPEGARADNNQFQAITGATYSTNGVKDILNASLDHVRKLISSK
jgi:Na+-transporting NADH:ubiquinone oxidoreductase subunit C